MALNTAADYVGQARYLLQDAAGERYVDASIYDALNNGMAEMYRMRPDIFFGLDMPTAAAGADLSAVPGMYRPALLDYVCGYAQSSDQDVSDASLAVLFRQRFVASMNSAGASA